MQRLLPIFFNKTSREPELFSPDKKNKQLKREGYRDRKCVLGIELFVMHREYSEITENIVFNRETKELSLGAKSLLV